MPITADLYYFVHGNELVSRPPVLLIHGAGGTHLNWPAQIRRLSGHRILALDLPGHGKSKSIGCQSIQDYADEVLRLMKALKLPSAIMVGHSMGSAIALSLAIYHPKHVLGLGLVGSGAKLRVDRALVDLAANPASFLSAIKLVTQKAYSPSTSHRLTELGAQRLSETRPAVLSGDFIACDAFDVLEHVGRVSVPAVIICGKDDQMTPLRRSEFLRDQIADAELHVVQDAGHMVMLEKPDEVAELLREFLDRKFS